MLGWDEQTYLPAGGTEHRQGSIALSKDRTFYEGGEICHVIDVQVEENREVSLRLLFDPGHSLEERILTEQFTP